MKKGIIILLKIIFYPIGGLLTLLILIVLFVSLKNKITTSRTLKKCEPLITETVKSITTDGFTFRDLNKNRKLDIYEDSRMLVEERVNDLVGQMTLEEKAGTMFFSMIAMKKDGSISESPSLNDPFSFMISGTSKMMFLKHINHFNILTGTGKKEMAM